MQERRSHQRKEDARGTAVKSGKGGGGGEGRSWYACIGQVG